jgi:aminoglycoside phosphotransferase
MSKPTTPEGGLLGLLEPGGDVMYLVFSESGRTRFAFPSPNSKVLRASMAAYTPTTTRALTAWKIAGAAATTGFGALLPGRRAALRPRLGSLFSQITGMSETYVSVASSFHGDRCVLGLIDRRGRHLGFAKVAPTKNAAAVERLENEVERLRWLDGKLVGIRIPKVLHMGRHEEFEVLVVTPIVGRSRFNASRLTPRRIEAAAHIFSLRGSGTTISDHLDFIIDDDEWDDRRSAVRSATERAADRLLPSGLLHGDFAPWNLIEDGERLGVIDWEHAQLGGLPFWDLWHFAVLTAISIRSVRMRRSILDALRGEGRLAAAIARYARICEVPAWIAPDVLLVYLFRQGALVRERARSGANDARRAMDPWAELLDESLAAHA